MKKKKFHCIFPIGENVHLIKDVGMIPFMLYKEGYYDSTISFYSNRQELPYLESDVKGLKYHEIKKYAKNEDVNIFIFLLQNFWKMNIVMMFHPSFKKILIAYFFKLLSFNQLKFYFKYDANESILNEKFNSKSLDFKLRKYFYNAVGIYSVETKIVSNFLNEKSYVKTNLLPNGFVFTDNYNLADCKNILWVGRVDAEEKRIQVLLDALSRVHLGNWTVSIVGPYGKDFETVIDDFFRANPSLIEKVSFYGNISNRRKLESFYVNSSVFVLTSQFESFGLVLVEALSKGNFLVSSDLASSKEISNEEDFGKLFPIGDSDKLSKILQDIIDANLTLPSKEKIIEYANENYDWRVLVRKLYQKIESIQ